MKPYAPIAHILALAIAFGSSAVALAEERHDHSSQHGGQFVLIDGHQGVEMVLGANSVTFYVTENDKPVNLNGASFKAVVQTKAGVKLYPLSIEGGTLEAQLKESIPPGAKIALTGKDGHGHTLQARFVAK